MQRYDNCIGRCSLAAIFLLITLLIASCHKENIEITPVNEEVTVTFSAKVPMASSSLKTYALRNVEETELKDIDILVFIDDGSGWEFHYRTVGKKITPVTPTGDGGGTV